MAVTVITLSAATRAIIGQPIGRPTVRLVLTSPWIADQPLNACQIDGVQANLGDRVLLTAQPDPTQNGIFVLGFTRSGGGALVGFFNSTAPGDNFRTRDSFAAGDVVFATSGLSNLGLWVASIGGPWNPDHTPVFFRPAPSGFGALQRLLRYTWRLSSSSASGFFGQTGTASGPGVRYRQMLAATARTLASLLGAKVIPTPSPQKS